MDKILQYISEGKMWEYIMLFVASIFTLIGGLYISPWIFFIFGFILIFFIFGFEVLKDDKWIIICLLLSILPGMLARFTTEPRGGTSVLLTDVLVGGFVFVWVFKVLSARKKIVWHPLLSLLFGFGIILILSWIQGIFIVESVGEINFKALVVSLLYLIRFFLYAFIPLIALSLFKTEKDIMYFVKVLAWIFLGVIIGGFIQRIFWPNFFIFFVKYGWDPHQDRLLGSFFDPNFIGAFLAINLVFFLSIVLHTKKYRTWFLLLMALGFIAMGLTLSRSAYLAFMFGFIVVTLVRARWLLVSGMIGIIILVAATPAVFNRISQGVSLDDSSQEHIESWEKAWHLTQMYPILGVGYNHLGHVQDELGMLDEWDVNNRAGFENSFLSVSVYAGLIGLISFILFWGYFFYYALKNTLATKNSRFLQGVSLGVAAAIVVGVMSSMLINTLFFAFIVLELWIMLAMVIAVDNGELEK